VAGITNVTFGGTLMVTNAGPALQPGDTFALFQAASYTAGFTNVVLPDIAPLVWNTNNLAVNGSIVVAKAPTTLTLTSSANPSGFNDSLTFTANLGLATPTGNVIFAANGVPWCTNNLVNGVTASGGLGTLPRGTNSVSAVYSGDGNYLGASFSLNQVVTNHPPVANPVTYVRAPGTGVKIFLADLLTNCSDADGDLLTLASCDLTTSNGVELATNSTLILYPSSTNNIADSFKYIINDGYGGYATNTVTIAINTMVTGQATINLVGQTATLGFFGIPGYKYAVQRSVNSMSAWQDLTTVAASDVLPGGTMVDNSGVITAPATGAFTVTDSDPPSNPSSVYYRLRAAP
jgi:hypothetical protein